MTKKPTLALLLLLLTLFACTRAFRPASTPKVAPAPPSIPAASAPNEQPVIPTTLRLDCLPAGSACRPLTVTGDAAYRFPDGSASPFSGYADPSIRQDPLSGTLWLAYSWPNYHLDGGQRTPGIDTHLAKSSDGGASWASVKSLWPSTPLKDPANPGQTGYLESEASNLLPVLEAERVVWYAARLSYFMPGGGGAGQLKANSFQLRVFKADSPEALSEAPYAVLGSDLTHPGWGVTQNLQSLSPELKAVTLWNEPALYYQDGQLFLITVGFAYDRSGAVMSKNGVFVFSTDPSGAPAAWQWDYNGQLAGPKEASELGGERLTQTDIARAADGSLLLLASPDVWNARLKDYNHQGCVALEIELLSPPRLKRDADGKLAVRAEVSASDSNELGSAACAYDPASSSGMLFTRRVKSATELTVGLWMTGLRP